MADKRGRRGAGVESESKAGPSVYGTFRVSGPGPRDSPRTPGRLRSSPGTPRRSATHLNDLQLHALVRLRALEAAADGLHDPVDQPLPRSRAVGGAAGQVAVRDQLLQGQTQTQLRAPPHRARPTKAPRSGGNQRVTAGLQANR